MPPYFRKTEGKAGLSPLLCIISLAQPVIPLYISAAFSKKPSIPFSRGKSLFSSKLLKGVGDRAVFTPAAETIHRAVKGKALTLKRGQIAAGRRILFKDKDLNPLACKNSRTCQTAYAAAYYYDIIILHPVRHPF